MSEKPKKKILHIDPYLIPFEKDIDLRISGFKKKKKELVGIGGSLEDFANGHKFFGFHRTDDGWVYREWAPAADMMYLTGDFNGWDIYACPMQKKENGVFEFFHKKLLSYHDMFFYFYFTIKSLVCQMAGFLKFQTGIWQT